MHMGAISRGRAVPTLTLAGPQIKDNDRQIKDTDMHR